MVIQVKLLKKTKTQNCYSWLWMCTCLCCCQTPGRKNIHVDFGTKEHGDVIRFIEENTLLQKLFVLKEDLTSQGGRRRRSKASSPVSPPLRWWCLIIPLKFTFTKPAVQASGRKWFNLFPLFVHWHRSALIKLVLKLDNKVGSLLTWPRSPSHRHLLRQSAMGLLLDLPCHYLNIC